MAEQNGNSHTNPNEETPQLTPQQLAQLQAMFVQLQQSPPGTLPAAAPAPPADAAMAQAPVTAPGGIGVADLSFTPLMCWARLMWRVARQQEWLYRLILQTAVQGRLHVGVKDRSRGPTAHQMQCPHGLSHQHHGSNQHAEWITCRRCGLRVYYQEKLTKYMIKLKEEKNRVQPPQRPHQPENRPRPYRPQSPPRGKGKSKQVQKKSDPIEELEERCLQRGLRASRQSQSEGPAPGTSSSAATDPLGSAESQQRLMAMMMAVVEPLLQPIVQSSTALQAQVAGMQTQHQQTQGAITTLHQQQQETQLAMNALHNSNQQAQSAFHQTVNQVRALQQLPAHQMLSPAPAEASNSTVPPPPSQVPEDNLMEGDSGEWERPNFPEDEEEDINN